MKTHLFLRRQYVRFKRLSRKGYAAFCSMHREVTIGRVKATVANLELLKAGKAALLVVVMLMTPEAFALEEPDIDQGGTGIAVTQTAAPDVPSSAHQQFSVQEVLVVASKAELQSDAYRIVSTISAEQIAALPVNTVADVLQYLPGLDIRRRGANCAQTDLSMRGGTFDQVLVLLNGVPVNDAQTGHYSLHLPLSTLLIERIEVLQGASAVTAGTNAFAGVINVVTKEHRGNHRLYSDLRPSYAQNDSASYADFRGPKFNANSTLKLTAGMNAFMHPEFAFTGSVGKVQINASAEYSRADGYYAPAPSEKEAEALANSDCRWANIYLQTRWSNRASAEATSWGDLDVQVGTQYKDAGAGLFYGGSTDQFDATRTAFGSARYKHHWGSWSLQAQVAYRANYDRYEWHRTQRLYGNFHFAQNATAAVNAAYASWLGTTTVGVELRNENIHSTNLGDTIYPDGQVPNVDGFELKNLDVLHLVKGKNRMNLTYFAQQTFHYDRLSASLGICGLTVMQSSNCTQDAQIINSSNTYFTGGANIGYEYLSGNTNERGNGSVYLNAQRAVRMPTFTDLYYDAGNQLGSRSLQPEKAWTFSLGGTYNFRGLSLTADAWYRLGENIIDWVYVPADAKRPYHAMNQQRINSAGTEITAVYRPRKMNQRSNDQIVNGEWLRSVTLSYAYTWLDLDLHEAQSRYLDYLSHKLVLGLEHGIWVSHNPKKNGVLAASWTLRWQKREGEYTSEEGVVMPYKPVLLLDGSLFWQNEHVKISAECTNITNRHYYDYGSLLMPGAWGTLALEVHL